MDAPYILYAPWHAIHHYYIIDEHTYNLFSGDNFGISYREFDNEKGAFIFPNTTPVQFDPGAMLKTLDRLLSYEPQAVYLTLLEELQIFKNWAWNYASACFSLWKWLWN